MTISHKRTFFENIAAFDEGQIAREVRRLLSLNAKENRRFDVERYRRELAQSLPPEKVERVMAAAMKVHEGEALRRPEKVVTAADLAREQRKALKKNMRSRRKTR